MILDGTKISLYMDRVEAWNRGERIAPITIDMSLTTYCNFKCVYCYKTLQHNKNRIITKETMDRFIDDCAEIGVKGISLVSDGESSISPIYEHVIQYARNKGLAIASATNGYSLKHPEKILPCLSYLRFNISAGEENAYNKIMGAPPGAFNIVINNIHHCMALKRIFKLDCTIGMQMVLLPEYADQIIPLSELAIDLGVDYLVIKHCSDDENGSLGVNYKKYKNLFPLLNQAESLSNDNTKIVVKWSKLYDGNTRTYEQCYGPPFIMQLSGTGLVAPCGMLFNDKYKKYHIGNIIDTSFKDIWKSDRYWEVINLLASNKFNAKTMCGSLCIQHNTNKVLDAYKKGEKIISCVDKDVKHKEFI